MKLSKGLSPMIARSSARTSTPFPDAMSYHSSERRSEWTSERARSWPPRRATAVKYRDAGANSASASRSRSRMPSLPPAAWALMAFSWATIRS